VPSPSAARTSGRKRAAGSKSSSRTAKRSGNGQPSKRKQSEQSDETERTGLRPHWSGTLSFGLVSIPVDLYSATRTARVSLRMLAPDGSPVSRRYFCPEHDQEVPRDKLARGYEYKPGKYVQVTDEELESIEPDKSRDIDLRLFVPASSLDPIYFDRTFFLAAAGDTTKAYHLLAGVMEKTNRAGIATFVMRDREYLIAIFAQGGLLCAEVLRFHVDVRDPSEVLLGAQAKPDAKLQKMFDELLSKHAHDQFDPRSLHDEHNEQLRELATKKARQQKNVVEAADVADDGEENAPNTVDLMKLLKQSLG
jgi:DNA end-binding protein Ku